MRKRLKRIIDLSFSKEIREYYLRDSHSLSFLQLYLFYLIILFINIIRFFCGYYSEFFKSNISLKGVVNLLQPVFIEDLSIPSLITLISGLIVTINGCFGNYYASNHNI